MADNKELPTLVDINNLSKFKELIGQETDNQIKISEKLNIVTTTHTQESDTSSVNYSATVDGVTELKDGINVCVKLSVQSYGNDNTLNINELGAKPIYIQNNSSIKTALEKNKIYYFVYLTIYNSDGAWHCLNATRIASYGSLGSVKLSRDMMTDPDTGAISPLNSLYAQALKDIDGNLFNSEGYPICTNSAGMPYKLGYEIKSNVPANAVFTDTTYDTFSSTENGLVPAPGTPSGKVLKDDGTWGIISINDNYIFCGSVDYNYQGGGSGYILRDDMMINLSNKGYNAYTKGTYYFPVNISEGSLFYYLTINNAPSHIDVDFNVSGMTSNVLIKLEIDENNNNTMYVIGMTDTGAKYLKGRGSSGGGTFNITTVDINTLTDYEPVKGFEECYLRDTSGTGSSTNISYGTDDLVAGESELADGALYFVYVE